MKRISLFTDFNRINENVIIPQEYLDFTNMLIEWGVPTELYGKDKYKTIGHLWQEIKEGETKLEEEDGQLIRRVQFVGARILYKKDENWIRLYEDRQVFKDGRVRRRVHMPYSAAEKFKLGEDPKEVIIRGVKEELDIILSDNQFVFYNKNEIENNDDYPGIKSIHTGHEFLVILNGDQYKEEGYVEEQKDKDVYFVWRPVGSIIKESLLYSILSRF